MAARCVLPVRAHRAPGADDGRGSRAGEWTSRPAAREPCPAGTRKTGSPERSLTGWVPVSRSGRAVTVTGMSNAATATADRTDRFRPVDRQCRPSAFAPPTRLTARPTKSAKYPLHRRVGRGQGPRRPRLLPGYFVRHGCRRPDLFRPWGPSVQRLAVRSIPSVERCCALLSALARSAAESSRRGHAMQLRSTGDRSGGRPDWRRRVRRSAIRGRRRRWVAGDVHRPRSPACPRPGDGGHLTGPRYLRAVRHRLRATPRQRQTRTVPVTSGRRS